MEFILTNLTDSSLILSYGFEYKATEHHAISPSASIDVSTPKHTSRLAITAVRLKTIEDYTQLFSCTFYVKRTSASWNEIHVEETWPWRIYQVLVSRKKYRLLIFPRRNLRSFLSEISDSVSLSSLLLPGTHDTLAFYGWPVAQCQSPSTPLFEQLKAGIRVLDVRLAIVESRLQAFHGAYPEYTLFQDILFDIKTFLTDPASCQETIVMSIKQEDFEDNPVPVFSRLVHDEIMNGPGGKEMWFLGNRIPLLGEVRGKVVLFSRFGGDGSAWEDGLEGMGIHPTTWPDSVKNGFEWKCKETLVRTHDWYSISSFLDIPEKVSLSTQNLIAQSSKSTIPTLSISYFSAVSIPLALPTTVARGFGWPRFGFGIEGVNARVGSWILSLFGARAKSGEDDCEPSIRGWTFMDFYGHPEDQLVVPLLVECNFRGREG